MPHARRIAAMTLLAGLALAPPALADDDLPEDVGWMALRAASGDCLEAAGGRVHAAMCTGDVAQLWSLQADHLVNGDGRCLSVAPRELGVEGARLVVTTCAERDAQRFAWRGDSLVDAEGLCLEGRATRRGTVVQTWECAGEADGQRWVALAPEGVHEDEPGFVDETAFVDGATVDAAPCEPAVVVQGPATVYVPPPIVAPPAPDPVEQVFRAVDLSIHTFRSFVDAFVPAPAFNGWAPRW
jgi:hypothetical protein